MSMRLNKGLLASTIRSADFQNRMLEEKEMWRRYKMMKKYSPREYYSSERSSSTTKYYDNQAEVRDDSESNFFTRQLYEFEKKEPERWGHNGYKELYPDEFEDACDSDDSSKKLKRKRSKKSKSLKKTKDMSDEYESSCDTFSKNIKRKRKKHSKSSKNSKLKKIESLDSIERDRSKLHVMELDCQKWDHGGFDQLLVEKSDRGASSCSSGSSLDISAKRKRKHSKKRKKSSHGSTHKKSRKSKKKSKQSH